MKTVLIERMSWTDFRDAMEETDAVIVPLGVMEEHGPHCPLGTDTWIARHCARLIGEQSQTPVANVLPFGYAANVRSFPGSTSLDPDTYTQVLLAYCGGFAAHGAKRFLFINGHGGNTPLLGNVADTLYEAYGAISFANDWWTLLPQIAPEYDCQDHGGYYETSMLMAARPELPRMELARAVGECAISDNIRKHYTWSFQGASIGINCDVGKFNPYGNLGNPPMGASRELGEKLTALYVEYNVALLEEIKRIPLPFPGAERI